MLRTRVIPTLLLRNESLVKTKRFGQFTYVGDPCNTVRIFNELEVDELVFLDITATLEHRKPNLKVLSEIANECFMPLAYGGGIRSLDDAKSVFDIGFEKIVVNTGIAESPHLLSTLAEHFGQQSVIASIDVKRDWRGRFRVRTRSGTKDVAADPVVWAALAEKSGAGEILLTSIDREGTWDGFDCELVKSVSQVAGVPVVAHGGAGKLSHIADVVREGGASAVALGSMVVFQKKGMGVLVNFPERIFLETVLS